MQLFNADVPDLNTSIFRIILNSLNYEFIFSTRPQEWTKFRTFTQLFVSIDLRPTVQVTKLGKRSFFTGRVKKQTITVHRKEKVPAKCKQKKDGERHDVESERTIEIYLRAPFPKQRRMWSRYQTLQGSLIDRARALVEIVVRKSLPQVTSIVVLTYRRDDDRRELDLQNKLRYGVTVAVNYVISRPSRSRSFVDRNQNTLAAENRLVNPRWATRAKRTKGDRIETRIVIAANR